jgi:hypothetical protein
MTKLKNLFHRFGHFAYPVKVLIIFAVFHFKLSVLPEALIGGLIGPCGIALFASIAIRVRRFLAKCGTCKVQECACPSALPA